MHKYNISNKYISFYGRMVTCFVSCNTHVFLEMVNDMFHNSASFLAALHGSLQSQSHESFTIWTLRHIHLIPSFLPFFRKAIVMHCKRRIISVWVDLNSLKGYLKVFIVACICGFIVACAKDIFTI